MKILIFSTAYLPFVGGAELAVKEITDRLSPADFSFDLITLNLDGEQKPEEHIGNTRVIRLAVPKWRFPFAAFRAARARHTQTPYASVWSIMASYGGFAGLFFKHHFPKVPFILTLQEGDSFSRIYRRVFFIWPLFKMIFTRADRITAISHYLADWARTMGATAPVSIIPNGVDVGKFKVACPPTCPRIGRRVGRRESLKLKGEEVRERLGIKAGEKVIITTSRLVEKNGVGDLIEAMRYLPENIKLFILGGGVLEKNLKLKTSNLQLAGRVQFLGHVRHGDIPTYLHLSNVYARPSRTEGMGSSFIEAMAAGLPVIATPVGGITDFLYAPLPGSNEEKQLVANSRELANDWGERITGLFCEVKNPKSIAEKATMLLSNDELRKRIVTNAEKMVSERYEWKGIVEKMKSIFA